MAAHNGSLSQKAGLFALPNELLITTLTQISTQLLLPLRVVSHRFHDLIVRIIHSRMLLAASLNDHKLILECYHPSSKNTEPYLFCDYLGTPGLTRRTEGDDSLYSDNGRPLGIGDLKGIYSRFRPIRPEAEELIFRPHPAGDVPGRPGPSAMSSDDSPRTECVKYNISLDSYELFSQLCVVANLVQLGPRRGVFYSFVNVADGVVRIWRAWLADKAKNVDSATGDKSVLGLTDLETKRHQGHAGFSANDSNGEDRMLWVDNDKTVGIRVRVKERKWRRDVPILVHNDEDLAVSYTMEYEELLIRTTHLLLAVERNLLEHRNVSGKAMIFGSFASRITR